MNSLNKKIRFAYIFNFKKSFSVILSLILLLSASAIHSPIIFASSSDFSVELTLPEKAEPGEQFNATVTVNDIICPVFDTGKGIFGVEIYLYYDSEYFTPAKGGFSASVPSKWETFDSTATDGVWVLFAHFDGKMENGVVNDGDLSFSLSFVVSEETPAGKTHFYIDNCVCAGYSSTSLLKIKSYDSSAYCNEVLTITECEIIIEKENSPITVDNENKIIYSTIPNVNFESFSEHFSKIGGELTITAFDYSVTTENGEFIPNGATVSILQKSTGNTFEFTYYLLGDCDCNGKVNVADLAVMKTVIINSIPTDGYVKYAMEFEKDGVVRIADYLRLKLYIATK